MTRETETGASWEAPVPAVPEPQERAWTFEIVDGRPEVVLGPDFCDGETIRVVERPGGEQSDRDGEARGWTDEDVRAVANIICNADPQHFESLARLILAALPSPVGDREPPNDRMFKFKLKGVIQDALYRAGSSDHEKLSNAVRDVLLERGAVVDAKSAGDREQAIRDDERRKVMEALKSWGMSSDAIDSIQRHLKARFAPAVSEGDEGAKTR